MLADYVRTWPHWGNWYLSTKGAALFNVANGYSEFGLDDLRSVRQLAMRVVHVVEKTWCGAREINDLRFALEDVIGMRVAVVHDYRHAPRFGSLRGAIRRIFDGLGETMPSPRVRIDDARNQPMLPAIYMRLRGTLNRQRG